MGFIALNKRLLILFLLLASKAYSLECYDSKIRYSYFGKVSVEEASFCTNATRDVLLSKNCKDKGCSLFEIFEEKKYSFDDLVSEVGNPGFKLCRKLGGKPQILEFYVDKSWYKLDRCIFENKKAYIDSGMLLHLYLK